MLTISKQISIKNSQTWMNKMHDDGQCIFCPFFEKSSADSTEKSNPTFPFFRKAVCWLDRKKQPDFPLFFHRTSSSPRDKNANPTNQHRTTEYNRRNTRKSSILNTINAPDDDDGKRIAFISFRVNNTSFIAPSRLVFVNASILCTLSLSEIPRSH